MRLSFWSLGLVLYLATACLCRGEDGVAKESLSSLSDDNPDWDEWDAEVRLSKRQTDAGGSGSAFIAEGEPKIVLLKFCLKTECTASIGNSDDPNFEKTVMGGVEGIIDGSAGLAPLNTFLDTAIIKITTSCQNQDEVDVVIHLLFIKGSPSPSAELANAFNFALNSVIPGLPDYDNKIAGIEVCEPVVVEDVENYDKIKRSTSDFTCLPDESGVELKKVDVKSLTGTTLSVPGISGTDCTVQIEKGKATGSLNFQTCNFLVYETVHTVSGTHDRYYSVQLNADVNGWLRLFCLYNERGIDASYTTAPDTMTVRRRDVGSFDIKFSLHPDPLYMEEMTPQIRGNADDFIYGQLYLLGLDMDTSTIAVTVDSCIMSTNSTPVDRSDATNQYLVRHRCPQDDTYETIPTKQSDMFKFRFKPTSYLTETTAPMYLHCFVALCYDQDEQCLSPSESECNQVEKRSLDSGHPSPMIYGPLNFNQPQQLHKRKRRDVKRITSTDNDSRTISSGTSTYLLLAVISMFVLINVLLVTAYVYEQRARGERPAWSGPTTHSPAAPSPART